MDFIANPSSSSAGLYQALQVCPVYIITALCDDQYHIPGSMLVAQVLAGCVVPMISREKFQVEFTEKNHNLCSTDRGSSSLRN